MSCRMSERINMTEKIGKITLDYSKYPGEDFYCDGVVEDELLEIVKEHSQEEFGQIIQDRKSWPLLYHLSPLRENIVDWIPMEKDRDGRKTAKVLEVGSGCGAITGALSRKAQSVTCVDLSKKRSLINAHRHKDCENITIHVGNFKDIEPDLAQDYNYICLIGVFEYGQGYIGGEKPFEDFLTILMRHLAADGRIIIAIENKYGLKYFAGCKEDHLGAYFSGIENYECGGGVRTFSRPGLERIFHSCGVSAFQFYYPYPDYKFMTTVYSDAWLPGKGELSNNLRNFDRDRMLLFDEKNAFDGLLEDGLFPVFSNSYVAVIGRSFDLCYAKYSNDRALDFVIRTQITGSGQGERAVYKYPLSDQASAHVRGMADAYKKLSDRYRGSGLEINRCELEEREDGLCARFEYVKGTPLSELMDRCLQQEDLDGFYAYFQEYRKRTGYNEEYPAADFDLVFSNILVDGKRWTLIDYEWTFDRAIPAKQLAYRAVYCYLLENEKRKKLDEERICKELGITRKEAQEYREQEMEFQKFVTGRKCSMAQMRDLIGYRIEVPGKWIDKCQDCADSNRVQIYEDTGNGYREEQSYFMPDAYLGENLIEMTLEVGSDVKRLRIDPAFGECVVKLLEVKYNGEDVPLGKRRMLCANGRIVKGSGRETGALQPVIVFATEDPGFGLELGRLKAGERNQLYVRLEIVRLSKSLAAGLKCV